VNAKRVFEFCFEFPADRHLERRLAWLVKIVWRNYQGRLRWGRELTEGTQDAGKRPGGSNPEGNG
jgi:hypothetical protein